MFDNIGGKVKTMASVFCVIGIVCSVIYGIISIFSGKLIFGIIVAVLGAFLSWLSCSALYAIGQSAENTDTLLARLKNLDAKVSKLDETTSNIPGDSKSAPDTAPEDSWWCTCGASNRTTEKYCSVCYKPRPNKK